MERKSDSMYTIQKLEKDIENGNKYDFLCFWGHQPSITGEITASCLSQWWECKFVVDGLTYSTAEQYMMAEKARLFGDFHILEKIMQATSPKEIKALGREIRNFDGMVWNAHRCEIVKKGNMAKFSQNPELLAYLKSTTPKILVEASPYDTIWGVGVNSIVASKGPSAWRGLNLLGFILTEVREML